MANPVYPVTCTQGQWTKIATAVTIGQIWRMEKKAIYFHTYRLTGEAAPTTINEGAQIFPEEYPVFEIISAHQQIDIYIWCKNADGIVRVDV